MNICINKEWAIHETNLLLVMFRPEFVGSTEVSREHNVDLDSFQDPGFFSFEPRTCISTIYTF